MHGELCFCFWPINNWGTGHISKIKMTAYKISMKVRFKNVLDLCFAFIGKKKVFIDVAKRVNDGRFAIAFNIISSFAKATGIQLFYIHIPGLNAKITEIKEPVKVREKINK